MVPRQASSQQLAYLLSLVSSTVYPPVPTQEELENLEIALKSQSSSLTLHDEVKKARKERKRKEREEVEERTALEANERTGLKLEAMERARQGRLPGSPITVGMRVKKERSRKLPVILSLDGRRRRLEIDWMG